MSWDVGIFRFGRRYERVADIPEDESTLLGPADLVRARIDAVLEGVDWSKPAWGTWRSPLGSVEFNLGKADPVESLALHVRGSDAMVALVVELCLANGWQGLDHTAGEFVERFGSPAECLAAWRASRDLALGRQG